MATRLELIQKQQARIGDEPLRTETDAGADTYLAVFEDTLDHLLAKHAWNFATLTRRLTRLVEPPAAHWRYYYQLPSLMVGAPRAVYDRADCRRPFTGYELLENRLATDAAAIWLRFTKRPDIAVWPGYFRELHTIACMAELALSVREDSVLADRLYLRAYGPPHLMGMGGIFGEASALDEQARPSTVVADGFNPFIDAREA